jgi:hypothetical protein
MNTGDIIILLTMFVTLLVIILECIINVAADNSPTIKKLIDYVNRSDNKDGYCPPEFRSSSTWSSFMIGIPMCVALWFITIPVIALFLFVNVCGKYLGLFVEKLAEKISGSFEIKISKRDADVE